jgi:hypothetical protein
VSSNPVRLPVMVGILTTWALSQSCLGQPQAPAASGEILKVLAAFRNRGQALNPIDVRYRLARTETAAWAGAMQRDSKSSKGSERLVESDARFACKGAKVWASVVRRTPPVSNDWGREDFVLYNGEHTVTKSNKPNEYFITKAPITKWPVQPPLAFVREEFVKGVLSGWADQSVPSTAAARETAEGGERLLRIDITYKVNRSITSIWVLPAKDYALRKFESRLSNGGLIDQLEITESKEFQGVCFPTRAVNRHYMAGGRLGYTEQMQVDQVELDPANVPDRLFQFEFPANADIYDLDRQSMVRRTDVSESQLDAAVRGLAVDRPLWTRWWAWASVVVGGLLVWIAFRLGRLRTDGVA